MISRSRVRSFPGYALIVDRRDDPELLADGYPFDLKLGFERAATEQQRAQVIEAVRWWASFGGVGARTRRGLGAVSVSSSDTELEPVSAAEVESRDGRLVLGAPAHGERAAQAAWQAAIDALQDFRQGVGVGRNPRRRGRPGRSRWPEPDAIRHSTGRYAQKHPPQHPAQGVYPRAAFGLPLVFHFKDWRDGDPFRETLIPAKHDRMASPLVLRPYFDGQDYRPAALLLPGWEERVSVRVRLGSEPTDRVTPAWPTAPQEREQLAAKIGPMRDRGTDALSAFMDHFGRKCAGC